MLFRHPFDSSRLATYLFIYKRDWPAPQSPDFQQQLLLERSYLGSPLNIFCGRPCRSGGPAGVSIDIDIPNAGGKVKFRPAVIPKIRGNPGSTEVDLVISGFGFGKTVLSAWPGDGVAILDEDFLAAKGMSCMRRYESNDGLSP